MSLYLRLRYCVLTCCYLFNFCLPLVLFCFLLFVCSLVAVTCFSVTFSYSKYYPLLMCRLIDMYQLLLHDLTQANYDVVLTMAFVFAFLFFFGFFLLSFTLFFFALLLLVLCLSQLCPFPCVQYIAYPSPKSISDYTLDISKPPNVSSRKLFVWIVGVIPLHTRKK